MTLHLRYGHAPFGILVQAAKLGLLPPSIITDQCPKCPSCLCGGQHKQLWHKRKSTGRVCLSRQDLVTAHPLIKWNPLFQDLSIKLPENSHASASSVPLCLLIISLDFPVHTFTVQLTPLMHLKQNLPLNSAHANMVSTCVTIMLTTASSIPMPSSKLSAPASSP